MVPSPRYWGHTCIVEELRGGELVEVRSGFLTIGEKYFRFLHQMYNYESKNLVATCDSVAVEASLETSRSVLLDQQVIERAKQHLVSAETTTHALVE